jgi:hypothetical protein
MPAHSAQEIEESLIRHMKALKNYEKPQNL